MHVCFIACLSVAMHACPWLCRLAYACLLIAMHACQLQCMLNNCTARTFRQVLIQRCHSTMLPQHLLVLPELNSRQHFYAKRITRSLTLIAVSLCKQAVMPLIFTISAGHTLLSALGLHAVSIGSACCQLVTDTGKVGHECTNCSFDFDASMLCCL